VRTEGLISINSSGIEAVPLKKKSAGLAWLLSMIVPGAGHFYCGTKVRGALVLGFSFVAMLVFLKSIGGVAAGAADSAALASVAFIFLPIFYVFGFLDAYFTAREINRGIDPALVDNPRVACILNLLTGGWGYFYLGERVKGVCVFIAVGLGQRVVPALLGGRAEVEALVSVVALLVSAATAADAYRIARRSFEAQIAGIELTAETPPSRLLAPVPLGIAGVIVGLLSLMLLAGAVAAALGVGRA
jgi:TM2 domain-containing membrane protein YozV